MFKQKDGRLSTIKAKSGHKVASIAKSNKRKEAVIYGSVNEIRTFPHKEIANITIIIIVHALKGHGTETQRKKNSSL